MSIKYNKFGEVVSVNGIVTGHHLGAPMQDAKPKRPEDNDVYATEMSVQTTIPNSDELLEEQPKPSGGASSWNDLTDRPFGEETVTTKEQLIITWDGNPEGRVSVNDWLFKVSDVVLTEEQIKLMSVVGSIGQLPLALLWEMSKESGLVTEDIAILGEFDMAIVYKPCVFELGTYASSAPTAFEFPEPGIYFSHSIQGMGSNEPIEMTQTTIKTIDPKYLPDSIGGDTSWNDLLDKPFGDVENLLVDTEYPFEFSTNKYKYAYSRTQTPQWISALSLNDEVVIEWDGVRYECTYLYDNYTSCKYIGNLAVLRSSEVDTGEPFCVLHEGTAAGAIYTLNASASHKIKVFKISAIKIAEKYLPEVESGAGTYVFLDTDFNDTIRQEVLDAVNSGKMVYCKSKQNVSPDTGHVYMPLVYFEQLTSNSYNFRFFAAKPNITYNPTGIATNVDFHFALTNGTTLVKKTFTHTFS